MKIICTDVGRSDTKIWTEGKAYEGTVSSVRHGLIRVRDDLGHERFLDNSRVPSFPMGTSGYYPNLVVYTARFYRDDM